MISSFLKADKNKDGTVAVKRGDAKAKARPQPDIFIDLCSGDEEDKAAASSRKREAEDTTAKKDTLRLVKPPATNAATIFSKRIAEKASTQTKVAIRPVKPPAKRAKTKDTARTVKPPERVKKRMIVPVDNF
jgi:hypothetical protein